MPLNRAFSHTCNFLCVAGQRQRQYPLTETQACYDFRHIECLSLQSSLQEASLNTASFDMSQATRASNSQQSTTMTMFPAAQVIRVAGGKGAGEPGMVCLIACCMATHVEKYKGPSSMGIVTVLRYHGHTRVRKNDAACRVSSEACPLRKCLPRLVTAVRQALVACPGIDPAVISLPARAQACHQHGVKLKG